MNTPRKKSTKERIKINVPLIIKTYPYATAAVIMGSFIIGMIVGRWIL